MTQRSAGKDAALLDDRRRPRDPGDGRQDFPCRLLEVAHRLNGTGLLVVPFLTAYRKLIPDQSQIQCTLLISVLLLARRSRLGRPHRRRGVDQQGDKRAEGLPFRETTGGSSYKLSS